MILITIVITTLYSVSVYAVYKDNKKYHRKGKK